MRKTTTPTLRIAALSLAVLLAVSGPAGAAWNPATPGQAAAPSYASEAAPAPASSAGSSQSISAAPLSATANPDAAGYDKKFKKGPWSPSNFGSIPTYQAGSGTAPTYQSICVMVQGYAYNTGDCIASKTAIDSLYNYVAYQFDQVMQWLEKIYNYMADGEGETGTGIIGIMGKEHDLDRKFLEEQLALNHARMQELMMKSSYANAVAGKIQDYRACDDLPNQMAGKPSAAGKGGGGSVAKAEIEKDLSKVQAGNEITQVAHAQRVYSRHSEKYCSSDDVTYKNGKPRNAFGCVTPSKLGMPDADARAQSVFAPAVNWENPANLRKQNLTYNDEQYTAAKDAIDNIVAAFSPPALPKTFEGSEQGKSFLAKTKVFNARASSAIHALSAMAERRVAKPNAGGATGGTDSSDQSSFSKLIWGESWKAQYKSIFGQEVVVPDVLSEADSLRFEAYRRYYSDPADTDGWYQKEVAGSNPDARTQEMMRIQAAQLLLLYNIHQRLEENNMMQAAILSHTINPVSKEELEQAGKAAFK